MSNTGRKIVVTLKQFDQTTSTYPGVTKPNSPGDIDYIPPTQDLTECPLPTGYSCPVFAFVKGSDNFFYSFSLAPSNYANPAVLKVRVVVLLAGVPQLTINTLKSDTTSNFFSENPTGLVNGSTYTVNVYLLGTADAILQACVATATVTLDEGSNCDVIAGLVVSSVDSSSVQLTWSALAGVTGYRYRLNGGAWVILGLVTTVTISDLISASSYEFEIRAIQDDFNCEAGASTTFSTEGTSQFIVLNESDAEVDITPNTFFTIATMPVPDHIEVTGTHTARTGVITFSITGDTVTIVIQLNNVTVDTLVSVTGTAPSSSIAVGTTDDLKIIIT